LKGEKNIKVLGLQHGCYQEENGEVG